jgi:hypothetical protein
MGANGPVAQLATAHKAKLLHGGEQTVGGGVGQAGLLRQLGERNATVGFGN